MSELRSKDDDQVPEQTTPEADAALAEWHQQRFLEADESTTLSSKTMCSHCGFPILEGEHVRSYGTHVAHSSESRCLDTLRGEIEVLREGAKQASLLAKYWQELALDYWARIDDAVIRLKEAPDYASQPEKRVGLETFDTPARYQCFAPGCPADHPSKHDVCETYRPKLEELHQFRGALVRVVLEAQGCPPDCSHEFHQWAIASVIKIASDALRRASDEPQTLPCGCQAVPVKHTCGLETTDG